MGMSNSVMSGDSEKITVEKIEEAIKAFSGVKFFKPQSYLVGKEDFEKVLLGAADWVRDEDYDLAYRYYSLLVIIHPYLDGVVVDVSNREKLFTKDAEKVRERFVRGSWVV